MKTMITMNSFAEALILAMLSVLALPDRRTKKIPVWIPVTVLTAGLLLQLACLLLPDLQGSLSFPDHISGLLIGICGLFTAFLTRESIGYGDGLVLCACGIWLGAGKTLELLFLAGIGSAFYACGMLLLRKAGRKDTIAFLPFLAGAQLLRIVLSLIILARQG